MESSPTTWGVLHRSLSIPYQMRYDDYLRSLDFFTCSVHEGGDRNVRDSAFNNRGFHVAKRKLRVLPSIAGDHQANEEERVEPAHLAEAQRLSSFGSTGGCTPPDQDSPKARITSSSHLSATPSHRLILPHGRALLVGFSLHFLGGVSGRARRASRRRGTPVALQPANEYPAALPELRLAVLEVRRPWVGHSRTGQLSSPGNRPV